MYGFYSTISKEAWDLLMSSPFPTWTVGSVPATDEPLTERDRIPERLPEMDRSSDPDRRDDDPDDDVASDAKPLAGQEPG